MAMTIVALLAAIVVPQYRGLRERGYVTMLKSDIRNLAVIEESYFYDVTGYTADLGVLSARGLVTSPNVVIQVREATAIGWSVTASHSATLRQCHLFVGFAAPVGSASEAGRIDCG